MAILDCHAIDPHDIPCVHKRCTVRLFKPPTLFDDIVTHHDCANNEMIALHNRHLVNKLPNPEALRINRDGVEFLLDHPVFEHWYQGDVMELRMQVIRDWIRGRTVQPLSYAEAIKKWTGAKRSALHRAHHKNAVRKPAGIADAFIKVDYYDEESATNKPPRMIQYRGPAFNLELDIWLAPAEELLLHGPGLGPTGLPSSSKGMGPLERAQAMVDKRCHFQDPVAICMDYSAFDSTQFTHILTQEHAAWELLCPGIDKNMLKAQLRNTCYTKNGIRYTATGTRLSGDRNTGGGNSLTNVANFYTICRMAGINAEFICDGDDSVGWMERGDVDRFIRAANAVVGPVFGMLLKDCTVVDSSNDEYYCQHKNIMCQDGVSRPTRDPVRILTRLAWTPQGVRGAEAADLLAAKLLGEMIVSRHVAPVAQFCKKLLVRLLDLGVKDVRGRNSHIYLRNMEFRSGVKMSGDMLASLDWVRDFDVSTDHTAMDHLQLAYDLPSFLLRDDFADEALTTQLHPSLERGCRKRIPPPQEAFPCDECDMSFVPRY